MRVLASAMVAAMLCLGGVLTDVTLGESGYQFELVDANATDNIPAPPLAEPGKPVGNVTLEAWVRLVMVNGKSKCELFAFQKPAELLSGKWKLKVRDTRLCPSALTLPSEAILALVVYDSKTGRQIGEVPGEAPPPEKHVKFVADRPPVATSSPCACLPSPTRTAEIPFGKPFDDVSGDLQLLLTCDDCLKEGKVTEVRVEAYLQFVTEGKPCCCFHKLDNCLIIKLGDNKAK